jgi:hypothetical protein
LLSIDLAVAGWSLLFAPEVTARHRPSQNRDRRLRVRLLARNALWVAWLRRSPRTVARATLGTAAKALVDRDTFVGLVWAVRGLPAVLRRRTPVPPSLEASLRLLDRPTR